MESIGRACRWAATLTSTVLLSLCRIAHGQAEPLRWRVANPYPLFASADWERIRPKPCSAAHEQGCHATLRQWYDEVLEQFAAR